MKIIIAILINTFLFVANIHGQENFNLLSDFPQYNKSLNRFYDTIAPALLKNLSKNPISRFTQWDKAAVYFQSKKIP